MVKMKIAILKETAANEKRVAATVDTVKNMISLGFEVVIESKSGLLSAINDDDYVAVGAKIVKDAASAVKDADIILKVQIQKDEIKKLKDSTIVVGLASLYENNGLVAELNKKNISCFAMEFVPRITRAQSMDVLSSQSNLAGYRAVIDASYEYSRAMPMMMTAAGTVIPAKVLVLGAGVAGLQAIATAKRLGAIVSAFDVRPAAKEQVESLGASFIEVKTEETQQLETKGGYAAEASEDYKKKQNELIAQTIKKQNIVITTALIPGRKAPVLVTKEMVESMAFGSVIVDIAAVNGGNCELTKLDEVSEINGVKIIGYGNYPSRLATDASRLYAKNLLNFLGLIFNKEEKKLVIDMEDEIVKSSLITYQGKTMKEGI